jgi:hypothetical protein
MICSMSFLLGTIVHSITRSLLFSSIHIGLLGRKEESRCEVTQHTPGLQYDTDTCITGSEI